ncbi:hypothetical protein B0T19DRAFT_262864 [Cercophora scortea]|uniref:Uncharacterized protein n=1 Tax=Cercophora scortea TaxID=314031 RepID=A0AAE0M6Y7_9PEZI|nr:hypothetical protein B0T19DRAFT_262864 [Cercophora scortea]
MTDSQARDDEPAEVGAASASAATETTPLLQHDSGRHDTGPRTDEEQTTASGLVEPPQLRELGRLLVASQRYMFLASIAAVVLGAAVVIVGDLHPPGYSWNWSIQHNIGRIILNSFMTFLWALANLVWLRYTTRLLPYLFGIIAHFFLALYTTGWAVDSIYVMVVYPPYCYPSAPDNGYERCPVWRSYYHILLWFYLVVALVLGLEIPGVEYSLIHSFFLRLVFSTRDLSLSSRTGVRC